MSRNKNPMTGALVIENGLCAQFVDGRFETGDDEVIDFLDRYSKSFPDTINRIDKQEIIAKKIGEMMANMEKVESANDLISITDKVAKLEDELAEAKKPIKINRKPK